MSLETRIDRRRIPIYVALLIGALLFARVGYGYTFATAEGAARSDILFKSATGLANLRVFAGGFHTGLCLVAVTGLLYRRFAVGALAALTIVTLAVVATRWAGILLETVPTGVPAILEAVTAAIFLVCLWLGTRTSTAAQTRAALA